MYDLLESSVIFCSICNSETKKVKFTEVFREGRSGDGFLHGLAGSCSNCWQQEVNDIYINVCSKVLYHLIGAIIIVNYRNVNKKI